MRRWRLGWNEFSALLGAAGALALCACSHSSGEAGPASPVAANSAPSATAAAPKGPEAAFERVRAVLQDPRCQNCHPPGQAPLQGDEGRPHDQDVLRGPEGQGSAGLGCSTCHGLANLPTSYGPNVPPGVSSGWRMPPPTMKMVFVGLSSAQLCEQLKDSKRNGGKDMAALFKHVSSDPLVLWGWSPGVGRRPVGVAHADFVQAFQIWADAGAPCPP